MRVVGQFNLGFMICLLGSDLFILDQHACDEKYNYEVLQETTTIHQQPLVRYALRDPGVSTLSTVLFVSCSFSASGLCVAFRRCDWFVKAPAQLRAQRSLFFFCPAVQLQSTY